MPSSNPSKRHEAPVVEIFDADGRHHFRLRAGTDVLLVSGDLSSAEAAHADAHRLLTGSLVFRNCMAPGGEYYFTVNTQDGTTIARSLLHVAPRERDAARETVEDVLADGSRVAVLAAGSVEVED
jgi:hypothetical protein